MELDQNLLDLASISEDSACRLQVSSWDVLEIHLGEACCLTQVIIKPKSDQEDPRIPTLAIHPLLYEYMCISYDTAPKASEEKSQSQSELASQVTNQKPVSVVPLPLPGIFPSIDDPLLAESYRNLPWTVGCVGNLQDLQQNSFVQLDILYIEDELEEFCKNGSTTLESMLPFFLCGRIIMNGTPMIVSTTQGVLCAVVQEIKPSNQKAYNLSSKIAFRLGDVRSYSLLLGGESSDQTISQTATATETWHTISTCSGYEKFMQDIIQILRLQGPAAPSGVLLTGSSQVGKSHLASAVANEMSRTSSTMVHWVSVQDLLSRANWADEDDLVELLYPRQKASSPEELHLLIIDDMHILGDSQESVLQEDAVPRNVDPEILAARNAILQMMDKVRNETTTPIAILGIAQSTNSLPFYFVRSGRFEKQLDMLAPTQRQREVILESLMSPFVSDTESQNGSVIAQNWAEALSPVTVGCVAGDLSRILASAWTKAAARNWDEGRRVQLPTLQWDDLKKAAQTYIPIQLQDVDVCKPEILCEGDTVNFHDWVKIHELSWKKFGGYQSMKKRLLRTVVGPWKRFLASINEDEDKVISFADGMGIAPPPGVLFHGDSGNGKTLAATCLGSSLGLPMINVKAADVMDKWLGGSEAIIRSLFARARSAAPCVLFFDEIDSIANNRSSGDEGGSEVMSRLLSTFLNEMDGISSDKRRYCVLVVACTNRMGDLDAALIRPGRLEEHIHLAYPTESDIKEILELRLAQVPLSKDVFLDELAKDLAGRNACGADVEGICHEACIEAVHRCQASEISLHLDDIQRAINTSRIR